MKYEFTGETKQAYDKTLKRIRRLSDGLVGGWIESELNLSQDGSCFVYGNARVHGDAQVYGNARVGGNAQVQNTPLLTNAHKFNITLTETHIFIGCEGHTKKHWFKHIDEIAANHDYTKKELKVLKKLLNVLLLCQKQKDLK